MKRIFAVTLLLLGLAGFSFGQTALTQTSLSAAVNGGDSYSGSSANVDTSVTLTSVTGVLAPINGSIQSYLYMDRELMGVTAVNTTTKVASVARGQMGTAAKGHANAQMVLIGPNQAFQTFDQSGACTAGSTGFTPWVNVSNGNQWICSGLTSTWVPGFGNNYLPAGAVATAVVASVAGTTLPSGPLFHISGTNAITAWGIPVGCNATTVGGCTFTVIPDAAFTTTATNNIATAVTAVANLAQIWTWDPTNSKFVVIQSK